MRETVIKRPTYCTASTTNGQADASGQTNEQASTIIDQRSATSHPISTKEKRRVAKSDQMNIMVTQRILLVLQVLAKY